MRQGEIANATRIRLIEDKVRDRRSHLRRNYSPVVKEVFNINILRTGESVDEGRDKPFAPCCGKVAETSGEKPIHQTATLRRATFADERLAKNARMEAGSVNSSPMQLGARREAPLTVQKARANARAALGSVIVKFAVMEDVAITGRSIAKNAAVGGTDFSTTKVRGC